MNPIIYRQGVCDPHIHIFENKAYLYATKDNPGYTESFNMTNWQIWSSEDLVHWKLERRIFPEELYCGHIDQCWAVDAAYKNGKYYWYFSVGAEQTGVCVGDSPSGPFKDALGKPLVDVNTYPEGINKWDPCCFIDDDGQAYLVVGFAYAPAPFDSYLIAKLGDNMISLKEELRVIPYEGNPNREDKATVHKHKGMYYLSHASYYATSDNVYGPYKYRGNFGANVDHNSFFSWHGQDYNASGGIDNPSMYYRGSFLCYVHYKKDGEIVVDQQVISYGVGRYDACWDKIESQWFFAVEGAEKSENLSGGFEITGIRNGSSLVYPNINNMRENSHILLRASCANEAGCTVEIRDSSKDGRLLGTVRVPFTGGWDKYTEASVELANSCGTNSLCFVFKGDEGELLHFDSFSFPHDRTERTSAEAHLGVLEGSARRQRDDLASADWRVSLKDKADSVTAAMDGRAGGEFSLSIRYKNENAESSDVSLYINDEFYKTLSFEPLDGYGYLNSDINLACGINKIKLQKDSGNNGIELFVDTLVLESPKSPFKSYSAAQMTLTPAGDGRWTGTPQRQNDSYAFTGRIANNLIHEDTRIIIENVKADEMRKCRLLFRYASSNGASFRLFVNGNFTAVIQFEKTGSDYMDKPAVLSVPICLRPDSNRLELKRERGEKGDLSMDAVTVIPDR